MADTLKAVPVESLPSASELESTDQVIAYRASNNEAYRATVATMAEAANANVSEAFSTTKDYSAGDYVIYNDTLYKFTADKEMGSWDASIVEQTTVADELSEINTNLVVIEDSLDISLTIDAETSFQANDYLAIPSTPSGYHRVCYFYRAEGTAAIVSPGFNNAFLTNTRSVSRTITSIHVIAFFMRTS